VIGNVDPPRDPGVPSVGDMPKNPVESIDAAGPADHSQVQPDRHHLRGMRSLAMQPVEGVDRIRGEIGGAAKPVGMEELHVVGVESIWQHQVPLVSDLHEIRQVVVVGVAVVEEATFLDQQGVGCSPSRADRVCQPTGRVPVTAFIAATVRAMRSRSSDSSRSAYLFPAPAMGRNLVAAVHGILRQ